VDFRTSIQALAVIAALVAGCAKEVEDPRSDRIDFGDPKSVVAQIFYAAESGRAEHLKELCDPRGDNDEDTARICRLTPDSPDWPDFRAQFAHAHLNGEPRVAGDRAALHFVFGPRATESETMELVRRDGRWYLFEF
jgi:hypothetical protein